jgi:hypothetical protein
MTAATPGAIPTLEDLIAAWDLDDYWETAATNGADVSPMGLAALAYGAMGWPVLPCRPRGKEPLVAGGYKAATTNSELIRRWWTQWPDANIGYRPEGRVVADIDVPDLVGRECHLPPTAIVATWRGFHYHYIADRPVRSRSGVRPGIDVKGEDGYVLIPPSVHSEGARYAWAVGPDLMSTAPPWLYEVGHRRRSRSEARLPGQRLPEGERNSYLATCLGAVRRFGCIESELLALARAINGRCDPPLLDRELRSVAASIARYPAASAAPRPHARTRVDSDKANVPSPIEIRLPRRWTKAEQAAMAAQAAEYALTPVDDEVIALIAEEYTAATHQPIVSRPQWDLLARGYRVHGDDFLPYARDVFERSATATNLLGYLAWTPPRSREATFSSARRSGHRP